MIFSTLKTIAGLILFCFLVFKPMQASLLASIGRQYGLDPSAQIALLSYAAEIDSCNTDIFLNLGDLYAVQMHNATMAAISYGKAMVCSPANALARFKFGEALILMGFDGRPNIAQALILEPHNPYFMSEMNRLRTAQVPSQ